MIEVEPGGDRLGKPEAVAGLGTREAERLEAVFIAGQHRGGCHRAQPGLDARPDRGGRSHRHLLLDDHFDETRETARSKPPFEGGGGHIETGQGAVEG